MTDHLPECQRWFTDMPEPDECPACEMFRSCERRVRDEAEAPRWLCTACWHREDGHTCERIERCMCRDCNYAAGLDAAREAVVAAIGELRPVLFRDYPRLSARDGAQEAENCALAAIDALRGQS